MHDGGGGVREAVEVEGVEASIGMSGGEKTVNVVFIYPSRSLLVEMGGGWAELHLPPSPPAYFPAHL